MFLFLSYFTPIAPWLIAGAALMVMIPYLANWLSSFIKSVSNKEISFKALNLIPVLYNTVIGIILNLQFWFGLRDWNRYGRLLEDMKAQGKSSIVFETLAKDEIVWDKIAIVFYSVGTLLGTAIIVALTIWVTSVISRRSGDRIRAKYAARAERKAAIAGLNERGIPVNKKSIIEELARRERVRQWSAFMKKIRAVKAAIKAEGNEPSKENVELYLAEEKLAEKKQAQEDQLMKEETTLGLIPEKNVLEGQVMGGDWYPTKEETNPEYEKQAAKVQSLRWDIESTEREMKAAREQRKANTEQGQSSSPVQDGKENKEQGGIKLYGMEFTGLFLFLSYFTPIAPWLIAGAALMVMIPYLANWLSSFIKSVSNKEISFKALNLIPVLYNTVIGIIMNLQFWFGLRDWNRYGRLLEDMKAQGKSSIVFETLAKDEIVWDKIAIVFYSVGTLIGTAIIVALTIWVTSVISRRSGDRIRAKYAARAERKAAIAGLNERGIPVNKKSIVEELARRERVRQWSAFMKKIRAVKAAIKAEGNEPSKENVELYLAEEKLAEKKQAQEDQLMKEETTLGLIPEKNVLEGQVMGGDWYPTKEETNPEYEKQAAKVQSLRWDIESTVREMKAAREQRKANTEKGQSSSPVKGEVSSPVAMRAELMIQTGVENIEHRSFEGLFAWMSDKARVPAKEIGARSKTEITMVFPAVNDNINRQEVIYITMASLMRRLAMLFQFLLDFLVRFLRRLFNALSNAYDKTIRPAANLAQGSSLQLIDEAQVQKVEKKTPVGASTLMSATPLTAEEYAAYKAGQKADSVSSSIKEAAKSHVGASTLMSATPLTAEEYAAYKAGQKADSVSSSIKEAAKSHVGASTLMSSTPLDMNEYLVETLTAAIAAKSDSAAVAVSSPVGPRRTEEYYRRAKKLLSAENYTKFVQIEKFYHDGERYAMNMATARKIIEILKTAPQVKEVHGVGYPFYGDVDIRMRIHQTLERLEAGEISETGFMQRITPDFDMVIVVDDDEMGPWQVSERMDDKLAGYLVRYVTSFRRQWAGINSRLQAEARMADLYIDRDRALDTLLNEGKYTLDLVYIPEHVWNEMPVFVEKDDADTFKVIRDLLFSLDITEAGLSAVTREFLQNTILKTLKGGAMMKEELLKTLLTEQPHSGMIDLYDVSERLVRAKMEKALAYAVDRGLIAVQGKDVVLSAKGKAYLAKVLARRQQLLDSGYDMDGRTYISELKRSSSESSSSPVKRQPGKKALRRQKHVKIPSLQELPVYQRGDSIQNYMEMVVKMVPSPQGMASIFHELFTTIHELAERKLNEKDLHKVEYLEAVVEDIYAPLAERLGRDDLSATLRHEIYHVTHQQEFQQTRKYIEAELLGMTYEEARQTLEEIKQEVNRRLEEIFSESGVKFSISSRVKSIYSIAEKLRRQERKRISDPLYDLLGLHVVIKGEISDYWEALNLISEYQDDLFNGIGVVIPKRTKYRMISNFDRYDSLHMGILVPKGAGLPLEIKFMDENNLKIMRFGNKAAHWFYKMIEMYPAQRFNFRQVEVEGDFDADFDRLKDSLSDWVYVQVYEPANKRNKTATFKTIKLKKGSIPADAAAMREINKLQDDYLGVETLRVEHDLDTYSIKSRQLRSAKYELKDGDLIAMNPAIRARTFKVGIKSYLERNRAFILKNAMYLRTVLLLEKFDFKAAEKGKALLQSLGLENDELVKSLYRRWGFMDEDDEFYQLVSNQNVTMLKQAVKAGYVKFDVVEVYYEKGQAREAYAKMTLHLPYDRIGLLKDINNAISDYQGNVHEQKVEGDNLIIDMDIPAERVDGLKDRIQAMMKEPGPGTLPAVRRDITIVAETMAGGLENIITERIAAMNILIDEIDYKEIEDGFIEWKLKVRTPVGGNKAIVAALERSIPDAMVLVKTIQSRGGKVEPKSSPVERSDDESSSPVTNRMTFAEFMAKAQTDYYGETAQIGRNKDFDTFVEGKKTAKFFGYATGRQITEMWERLGRPEQFSVVEMGAGNGTYALNIMRYLKQHQPQVFQALDYVIVEFSPNLRENQRAKLQGYAGKVRWIEKSVLDVTEQDLNNIEGVFLSNELMDDLPGHRLKMVGGEWQEIYSVEEGGTYRDETGDISSQELKDYAADLGVTLAEGTEIFVQPAIHAWQQMIARTLKRGFVISIDYGGKIEENVEGRKYSIWSGKEERIAIEDIYAQAGEINITAMVNFYDVAKAGERYGLKTAGFTYQRDWLWNLDEGLVETSDSADHDIGTSFGFKVLIQTKGVPEGVQLTGLQEESRPEDRFSYLFSKTLAVNLPENQEDTRYVVFAHDVNDIPAKVIRAGRSSVDSYIRSRFGYSFSGFPGVRETYKGYFYFHRADLEDAVIFNDKGDVIFNGPAFFAANPGLVEEWGLTKGAFTERYASRVDLSRPDTDTVPEIFTLTEDLGLKAAEPGTMSSPVVQEAIQVTSVASEDQREEYRLLFRKALTARQTTIAGMGALNRMTPMWEADFTDGTKWVGMEDYSYELGQKVMFEMFLYNDEVVAYGGSHKAEGHVSMIFRLFEDMSMKLKEQHIRAQDIVLRRLSILSAAYATNRFVLESHQFSGEEAVKRGAVVFYWKLGFRNLNPIRDYYQTEFESLVGKLNRNETLTQEEIRRLAGAVGTLYYDLSGQAHDGVTMEGRELSSPVSDKWQAKGWVLNGKLEDIQADIYRSPKDPNLPAKYVEVIGIKNKVVITLPDNRVVMAMDDHNHAYSFWWLMLQEGRIAAKGNKLLHIDAHADAELTRRHAEQKEEIFFKSGVSFEEIDRYSQNVLGIQGFIAPLVENGFLKEWHFVYNLEDRMAHPMVRDALRYNTDEISKVDTGMLDFNLLDIDIDVLRGLNTPEKEAALDFFAQLARRASLVTIATSPNFIDQEESIYYAKKLVEKMAAVSSSTPVRSDRASQEEKAEGASSPVELSITEVPFSGSRVSDKAAVSLRFVPIDDDEEVKETVIISMDDIMRPSSFLESLLRLWKQFLAMVNRFFGRYTTAEESLLNKVETAKRTASGALMPPSTLRMIDPALVAVAAKAKTPVGASTLMSSTPLSQDEYLAWKRTQAQEITSSPVGASTLMSSTPLSQDEYLAWKRTQAQEAISSPVGASTLMSSTPLSQDEYLAWKRTQAQEAISSPVGASTVMSSMPVNADDYYQYFNVKTLLGQASSPVEVYRDREGVLRVDTARLQDGPVQAFLEELDKAGLKGRVFLYGRAVRDMLRGETPEQMGYLISEEVRPEIIGRFHRNVQARVAVPVTALGKVSDYNFEASDLAVNRMMLVFDDKSVDPVLKDPFNGYEDLIHNRAHVVGEPEFILPGITEQMIRLNMLPSAETREKVADLLQWLEGPYAQVLEGEYMSATDEEYLVAAEGYKLLDSLKSTGENLDEVSGHLWETLEVWAGIRGRMHLTKFSVKEVFGLGSRAELRDRLRARQKIMSGFETERANSLGRTPEQSGRIVLRDIQDGEWIISPELGLGRTQATSDGITFQPAGIDELAAMFDTTGTAPASGQDNRAARVLTEQDGPFFRWTQTRGRITQVTEAAYRVAGRRAQAEYSATWFALRLAFEVFKQRVYMEGDLGAVYRDILSAQSPAGNSLDERIRAVEDILQAGRHSIGGEALRPVVSLISAVSESTNDDLVRAGVLNMLSTMPGNRIAGTLSADTWFFWTTELLEKGIAILAAADAQTLSETADEHAGVSAMKLYPRSHPQYPVDEMSKRYFAAKSDSQQMAGLGREYADQLVGLLAQHGFSPEQFDYIVPVPKQRGQHNQLLALADIFAERTGLPVRNDVTVKVATAQEQKRVKSLPGKALNVVQAYAIDRPEDIKDKSIIVIDDHAGTRLTLLELKYILLNAGAKQVFILALSESPAKDGVNREVQVGGVYRDLAQNIAIVQQVLRPARVQAIFNDVVNALPQGVQARVKAAAEAIGVQVADILFRHNLIDEWAADLSSRLINEDDLAERVQQVVKRLLEQTVDRLLADGLKEQAGPYVMRTNPARAADILSGEYFAQYGIARPRFRLILSDYDGTLAETLTELEPAVIREIVRQLKSGVIFGLVTQQNLEEIEYFFLEPVRRFLAAEGLDAALLNNLYFFAASGHTAYRTVAGQDEVRIERLDDFEPILSREQAEHLEDILWEFDTIRPNHVGNRENGIWTLYFNSALDKDIARSVLTEAFAAAGLPVDVVNNGTYRLRVVAQGLSKARIWDYASGRFADVLPEEVLVLGDNYDPENELSDIGLKKNAAVVALDNEAGIVHRELLYALKRGAPLQEILWTRGIQPEEGLRYYEGRVILPGLRGNVYRYADAAILTRKQALEQLGANSILYLLPGDGALLVEDITDAVELTGLHVTTRKTEPRVLTATDKRVLEWVERETQGDRGAVVKITLQTAETLGLNSVSQLDRILRKSLKLSNVDGVPAAYIGYRREAVVSSAVHQVASSPVEFRGLNVDDQGRGGAYAEQVGLPKTAEIFYGDVAQNGWGRNKDHSMSSMPELIEHLYKNIRGRTILSIGSGRGELESILSEHNDVKAIDVVPEMVRAAQKRSVRAILGNVYDLSFSDDEFNLVIFPYSISHIENLPVALAEARRVLKDNGKLLIIAHRWAAYKRSLRYYVEQLSALGFEVQYATKNIVLPSIYDPSQKIIYPVNYIFASNNKQLAGEDERPVRAR